MIQHVEVLIAPAEFDALPRRDLARTACVVLDVLRATSSMVAALANGAAAIVPVAEIQDALEFRRRDPAVLLAGERDGLRIGADQTGGIEFDFGNSPREFVRERVAGRTIVMTTTNGTRALRACHGAAEVLAASFLNLRATAERVRQLSPDELIVVCGGTFEEAAYEDTLGAGALCDLLWQNFSDARIADSALMARLLWHSARPDLPGALSLARNARRLLSRPELSADVPFCLRTDSAGLAARLDDSGRVRAI